MVNNTLKFILLYFVFLIGLTFALVLIYASSDNIPHTFEASLFFLASVIVIFSLSFNLSFKVESNNLMKSVYAITLFQFTLNAIVLALICKYAHPIGEDFSDMTALYIFGFSASLLFISFIDTLRKKIGEKNA